MPSTGIAQKPTPCRVAVIEGEVRAGQTFERPLGNGLEFMLEAIPSGWIVRVLPAGRPRGQHDFAELATPPYRSVSPLLVGTDFSFRAQDAIAWNPRRFRFAPDQAAFLELQRWYDVYDPDSSSSSKEAQETQAQRSAATNLVRLAYKSPEAELTILDAHLVQGTADQTSSAALVASHLSASAHEVDQAADGKSTPLGKLNWIRFRVRFDLPSHFRVALGPMVEQGRCFGPA